MSGNGRVVESRLVFIRNDRQYRDFTNTHEANYAARLRELLADIRGDATATLPDTYRKTRVTYLTAPPRLANYLERVGHQN